MGGQPSEPVPLTTTQNCNYFFIPPFSFIFEMHLKNTKKAQEKCEKAVYHLPLGKANTLMIRKKKITERIPLQMLSSGTESSLVKAKYMRLTMVKLSRVMVCGR